MLEPKDKEALLFLARETLDQYIKYKKTPKVTTKSEALLKPGCVFVSLHKNKELRGCIGSIEPIRTIWQAVQEMAIESAAHDPRFESVSEQELDDLQIEISVLSPLKRVYGPDEIKVGCDGIYIKKEFYSGLLLPQVAVRFSWQAEEFLKQTCIKAMLHPDAWKEPDTEIYIFQADIFSIGARLKILFACVRNSARSQMAEAFANIIGKNLITAYSAGSKPASSVNPLARQVMQEEGIDLSKQAPKGPESIRLKRFDILVTLCKEECLNVPAKEKINWQIDDPEGKDINFFKKTRDQIEDSVRQLIESLKPRLIHI